MFLKRRPEVDLVFLFAMEEEALPFIKKLTTISNKIYHPKTTPPHLYGCFTVFEMAGIKVGLSVSSKSYKHGCARVGTESAMQLAVYSSIVFDCDRYVSAGTCGSVTSELKSLQVVTAANTVCYFDRHIEAGLEYKYYGQGHYATKVDRDLVTIPKVQAVKLVTGNSFDSLTDRDYQLIADRQALIKDMEAASIAQFCDETRRVFYAVKCVTNSINDKGDVFYENLSKSSIALSEVLFQWVQRKSNTSMQGIRWE